MSLIFGDREVQPAAVTFGPYAFAPDSLRKWLANPLEPLPTSEHTDGFWEMIGPRPAGALRIEPDTLPRAVHTCMAAQDFWEADPDTHYVDLVIYLENLPERPTLDLRTKAEVEGRLNVTPPEIGLLRNGDRSIALHSGREENRWWEEHEWETMETDPAIVFDGSGHEQRAQEYRCLAASYRYWERGENQHLYYHCLFLHRKEVFERIRAS
ncbi:MAG: hypothetical protein EON58_09870 [Alphaproteobacteria bacterium]|nr:MAG: hypothetical protein EON58_09870 [Alphaproteobacteria bacterium]